MRLVLDTDVVVAGLRSNTGASRRLITGALERRFQLLISVPLALEYEAVAFRPHHIAATGGTAADVEAVVDELIDVAEPVFFSFR